MAVDCLDDRRTHHREQAATVALSTRDIGLVAGHAVVLSGFDSYTFLGFYPALGSYRIGVKPRSAYCTGMGHAARVT